MFILPPSFCPFASAERAGTTTPLLQLHPFYHVFAKSVILATYRYIQYYMVWATNSVVKQTHIISHSLPSYASTAYT